MGPPGRTLTAPPAPQSARGSAGGDGPRGAIVLIGFMGAGKSRTARELAVRLGVRALDSDELLEAELGHSIQREFELHGEGVFREREERLVLGLLASARPGDVIALGGGSVLSERVREALGGTSRRCSRSIPGRRGSASGGRDGHWRASVSASRPCTPSAGRSMKGSPTRSCRRSEPLRRPGEGHIVAAGPATSMAGSGRGSQRRCGRSWRLPRAHASCGRAPLRPSTRY